MKHYKKRKTYNPMEHELLAQKLEKIMEQNEELQQMKDNTQFVNNILTQERDRAQLATKYLTHLFLVMDSLDKILYDDYPLGWIVRDAIISFKAKLNDGMLDIKYDGQNLWFDGNNNDEMNDDDEETEIC